MSHLHVDTNATASSVASSPSTTMFFKSSENSCCGSVTVKSEQYELAGPAVCRSYLDARIPDVDGVEKRQEFWSPEMPVDTPFYQDLSFAVNGHGEAACSAFDVGPAGHLLAYEPCRPDTLPLSTSTASIGTALTTSELPLSVRCLLTPPDSLDSSPNSPTNELMGGETTMLLSPDEEEIPKAITPDDDTASLPENGEYLVLTPVTRRPRRTHPGCTTIKYNRKNNPELDRRRVHYCEFPG